jgi:hypothetical protein
MLNMPSYRSLTVVSDTDGDEDLNHVRGSDINPWIYYKRQDVESTIDVQRNH